MDFLIKCSKNLREQSLQKLYVEKKELSLPRRKKEGMVFNEEEVLLSIYSKYKKEFPRIVSSGKLVFYSDNSYGKESGLFKVWMTHRFPIFSRIFIGYEDHNKYYYWLNQFSMKQIVQYLPIFILRQLEDYLKKEDLVLIVRHLMEGKNIRTFKGLPFPMTKKMAHIFHNLNFGKDIFQVYYRSLVYGLGGSVSLFEMMKRFWVPGRSEDLTIIKKVVPFFSQHTQLNAQVLRSLLGYVNHMFQEHENFQLKGRTISSLRRASNAYYDEMNRIREENSRYYGSPKPETWDGANYQEWSNENGFKIIQLKTSIELNAESSKMRHCVRSYAHQCGLGNCSIWSLRYLDENNDEDTLVTIEVNRNGTIIQAKAEFNQTPSSQD